MPQLRCRASFVALSNQVYILYALVQTILAIAIRCELAPSGCEAGLVENVRHHELGQEQREADCQLLRPVLVAEVGLWAMDMGGEGVGGECQVTRIHAQV